jgi:hypothetical protein
VSVTVTVTVWTPMLVYVCVAVAPAWGPVAAVPSPKSKLYVAIGDDPAVDPDASAVTWSGPFPEAGVTASWAVGGVAAGG